MFSEENIEPLLCDPAPGRLSVYGGKNWTVLVNFDPEYLAYKKPQGPVCAGLKLGVTRKLRDEIVLEVADGWVVT